MFWLFLRSQAPEPARDGVARILDDSPRFVNVETVLADDGGTTLTVPARVAFKDGSFSQLGAPVAGHVVRVHIRLGDQVQPGDPLVTLDCTSLETAADSTLVIRAPIAGTILNVMATSGSMVQPGSQALIEIGDPAGVKVLADIMASDLSVLRLGQRAELDLASFRRPLQGSVTSIGAINNGGLCAALVEISIEGDITGLRPGTFGRVHLHSNRAGMWLPAHAVLCRGGGESVVYVARQDGNFAQRVVVVAQPIEGRVRVLSGLSSGERVAAGGVFLLDNSSDIPF
jgi:multidrug efflux pump subunit AcrA (membrane-fusion protein)